MHCPFDFPTYNLYTSPNKFFVQTTVFVISLTPHCGFPFVLNAIFFLFVVCSHVAPHRVFVKPIMDGHHFGQVTDCVCPEEQIKEASSSIYGQGLDPSLYDDNNGVSPYYYLEQIGPDLMLDTDLSCGLRPSPEFSNCADMTLITKQSSTSHRAIPNDANVVLETTRKRKRGRQTNAAMRRKYAAAARRANAPPSRASIRRAELAAQYGAHMIGADEEVKGETRSRSDGFLDWKEPGTGKWLPAAPHDWFRMDFIDMSKMEEPYVTEPGRGLHDLDITSKCSVQGQNTWIFDPQGWYHIVDMDDNRVMFMNKAPIRLQAPPQGSYWRHKRLIMLDPDDHPVLDWTDIPMVFSSRLEGGRMEALKRVFPWLKNADFRARMPRMVEDEKGMFNPLPKYSTFGQRLSRFRDRNGCSPWTARGGTKGRWKRVLRERTEDAEDTESTLNEQSVSESATEGNDYQVNKQDIDECALQPRKRRRTSSILSNDVEISDSQDNTGFSFSQNYTQLTPVIEFLAEESSTSPDQCCVGGTYPRALVDQFDSLPAIEPSPHSCKSSNPSKEDLRFVKPSTPAEKLSINKALLITRADFQSIYTFDAPITCSDESYHTQFQIIQAKHEELWVVDDNPPFLISIGAWYGSFKDWPVPKFGREDFERLLLSSEPAQSSNIF